ncbi:MAG: GntR family transcriptional regulator [Holophaga sp.]|jgi:DNA-binding GntR family transcriptional regulator
MPITRKPLRADVHQELLGMLLQGELAPGQRLSDSELAQRLGVSRTPVREALLRLEREGFLSSQLHQGFSVKPLIESEIRDVYPLVGLLERSALEEMPAPSPDQVDRLAQLGRAMHEAGADPLRRIELDQAWHQALIAGCGNQHLARILDDLKQILFRYEYAFMQVPQWVEESAREHQAIARALEGGRRREAARLLDSHWERTMKAILDTFFRQERQP